MFILLQTRMGYNQNQVNDYGE